MQMVTTFLQLWGLDGAVEHIVEREVVYGMQNDFFFLRQILIVWNINF